MINISAELDLNTVKEILECTSSGASSESLAILINTPCYVVKMYLFYLVEYTMVSYSGDKRMFVLTGEGQRLLFAINETNQITNFDDDEYVTTITLD